MTYNPAPWTQNGNTVWIHPHCCVVVTTLDRHGRRASHGHAMDVRHARLIAETPAMFAALRKLVADADKYPFNPLAHELEHGLPEIRELVARLAPTPAPTTTSP